MGATEGLAGTDWFADVLFGGGGKGCILDFHQVQRRLICGKRTHRPFERGTEAVRTFVGQVWYHYWVLATSSRKKNEHTTPHDRAERPLFSSE
jgi:hypothetical protein